MVMCALHIGILLAIGALAEAQTVRIRPVGRVEFPALVDSNSPAYWSGGQRFIYNSYQMPIRSEVADTGSYARARVIHISPSPSEFHWIEGVWSGDGEIFAWYHTEPWDVCPGTILTAPKIGALVSEDGVYFRDLGIILEAGGQPDCSAGNLYFAGGNGDFSVVLDQQRRYFYFIYTNYGGPAEQQGIAMARMAFGDRYDPVGRVWKFYDGGWSEPGVGGQVTPVFAARRAWSSGTPDSFWGPSIHYNTALGQYVVLLNQAVDAAWNQGGIHIAFSSDLADAASWTAPEKLIWLPGWYPQVLGYGEGETDSLAGARARLFMMGESRWEVEFEPGPLRIEVEDGAPVPEPAISAAASSRAVCGRACGRASPRKPHPRVRN